MRPLALLVPLALAACAGNDLASRPLAARAAEAIDPRVPVPEAPVAGEPSAELLNQLNALIAQALAGDTAFRPAADAAERLASSAGPPQSESWIVAQQALSAAVAARAPVTRALAEIDSLGASRIQRAGGMSAADLAALQAASARVAEIDASESALIDRVQARLRG